VREQGGAATYTECMIKWNEPTWYSRIAAIILFIGVLPIIAFDIGIRFDQTTAALETVVAKETRVVHATGCTDVYCSHPVGDGITREFNLKVTGIEVADPSGKLPVQVIPATELPIGTGLSAVSLADDVNFDGYQDLKITIQQGKDNSVYDYWLFDPVKGQFVKNMALANLINPVFNAGNRTITTQPVGGQTSVLQYGDGAYTLAKQ
jgi:hypothetical protein